MPLAGNCQLHDMVDGRILVSCTERGYLIGAASGKKTQLPGRVDWIALGKRWAGGYTNNESATRFVNLRTLRVIKKGSMPADLDGAEPPKPLPVGVQIRMHDGDLTFEWFTKTVNPPFDSRFTLTRRRAHRKPLRLLHARADAWPSGFELGSRFATWSVRVTAYGFDVKRRKRIKWTFPNAAPGEFHNPVHVAHTRRHVFFGVPVADGYELYVARRPG